MKLFTFNTQFSKNKIKTAGILPVAVILMFNAGAKAQGTTANFSFDNVCQGNSISFSNSSTPETNIAFEWTFGDGTTDTSRNPSHLYSTAGEYNVSLKVTSDSGVDSIMKKVVIFSLPIPEFTYIKGCTGDAIAFTDSSSVPSGNATYSWNFGDGTASAQKNPSHVYRTASNFLATLKVTTDNGCSDFVSKVITRYPQPVADFVWSEACEGDYLSMYSASNITEGSIKAYKWEFGDGGTSAAQTPQHLFQVAGSYDIKLVATSDKGCKDSIVKNIQVNAVPVADFTYDEVCEGSTVSFKNNSSTSNGTITDYKWVFGDGATANGFLAQHNFSTGSELTVTLKAVTDKGCAGQVTKSISFKAKPIVNFNYTNACVGDSVSFQALPALSGGSVAACSWTFGDGSASTSLTPKHQFPAKKSYSVSLSVTASNGCSDSLVKQVQIAAPPVSYFTTSSAGYREVALNPVETYAMHYDWSFGDGSTSSEMKPVHSYSKDSSFQVVLKVTSDEGCVSSHASIVNISTVSIAEAPAVENNKTLSVYPNPFAGAAHINYSLSEGSDVKLKVTDIMGKELAVLASGRQMAGDYTYDFSNNTYGGLSGVYYVTLQVGESVTTTKIVAVQ
jgi:PKD repeat protein